MLVAPRRWRGWFLALLPLASSPACWVSFDERLLPKESGADRARRDAAADGPVARDAGSDARSEAPRRDLTAPDLLGPDLPSDCKVDGDCDDKLACTSSTCTAGKCVHTRLPGFCVIANVCVASGAASPANPCLGCTPSKNPTAWSTLDGASCDDGVVCTHTDKCAAGVCQGTPYACNDGLACTADSCTGKGPAPAGCAASLLSGYCLIQGACYASGATQTGKPCEVCKPATSTTAWTSEASCVTTIAGDGTAGFANGPALSARFNNPYAIAVSPSGAVYVGDELNQRIRSLSGGQVTTVAGAGTIGQLDGPAAQATFSGPRGVAISGANLYVGDTSNHRIRLIASGQVSTIAGTTDGYLDGPAATAQLSQPKGIAVDGAGTIYVADYGNHCIRTITNGQVATLAGNGLPGSQDGPIAAARFRFPRDLIVDGTGHIYVADSDNHRIRMIWNGQVSTVAGSGTPGYLDGAATSARFNTPYGVSLGASGRLYVADTKNHRIRLVWNGQVTSSAGSGTAGLLDGPTATARFNEPNGIAVDAAGKVFVADHLNHVIRAYTP